MKLLVVSDIVVDWIYSPRIRLVFPDVDLVLGCGDLPLYYMEYMINALDIPLFHVHGNHSTPERIGISSGRSAWGGEDLHSRVVEYKGYTFAGVEGSLRYKKGLYQYSQFGMWLNIFKLIPSFLLNKRKNNKYLNVFISHAPPWGVHDQSDPVHQGIKAFRWLLAHFEPDYHFHGHIHVYRPDMVTETMFGKTRVINAYGYRKIEL